jgi:hypothetical protein
MLVDDKRRIIAASDERGLLLPLELDRQDQTKGYYWKSDREVGAFAKTFGYQEYDGLGWCAVIMQRP